MSDKNDYVKLNLVRALEAAAPGRRLGKPPSPRARPRPKRVPVRILMISRMEAAVAPTQANGYKVGPGEPA